MLIPALQGCENVRRDPVNLSLNIDSSPAIQAPPIAPQLPIDTVAQPTNSLKVLTFGDSGSCNDPEAPSTCTQNRVARSMAAVCAAEGCDMGVLLGDSIYNQGVSSEYDDQLRYKYEFHYSPLAIPIYVALGNHDIWGANISKEEQVSALVNYSKHSTTWRMESAYYQYVKADVHFFVIDSNDFDSTQERWLDQALQASSASWKVVYGHHPIHSNGTHGDTPRLVDKLLPIVCAHADIYLAGHDHDLQLLKADCGIPLVVSGAAGKIRASNTSPTAPRRLWSTSNTYGFTRLIFHKAFFEIHFYDGNGTYLYDSSVTLSP